MAAHTMIGRTLRHYTLEAQLGKGGMGEVYSAHDQKLDRSVAIKILPDSQASDSLRRFTTEARAASALNHPNIVTVHDIDSSDGVHFIVMEKIDGTALAAELGTPMPLDLFFDRALQIADAVGVAHRAGIIHRDLKPGNVMLTSTGRIKIVDFGLARLGSPMGAGPSDTDPTARWSDSATQPGTILGTVGYMSPEQIEGARADSRSDVFSLGVIFYAMLTGREPFRDANPMATLASVLRDDPPAPHEIEPSVPIALSNLILECLAKEPHARPADAAVLRERLEEIRATQQAALRPGWKRVTLAAVAIGITIALLSGWFLWRARQQRWARDQAPVEIEQRLAAHDPVAAWKIATRALAIAPDDAQLHQVWTNLTFPFSFQTTPPGAEVAVRSYRYPNSDWTIVGKTPIENFRLPYIPMRIRISLAGHVPVEIAPEFDEPVEHFRLFPPNAARTDMVFVSGGSARFEGKRLDVADFWIDRTEVTNEDFQKFVDAGGYRRREYWRHPFLHQSKTIPFEEAMKLLVDRTGTAAPATWELGSYTEGKAKHPVEGISWYEALAYAEWAGKSLPTVFHWMRAASLDTNFSDMILSSNFAAKGSVPVGSTNSLGPWGTYDIAGNVEEWTLNAIGEKRFVLGGSWTDPMYQFRESDARDPMDRSEGIGFRLMNRMDEGAQTALLQPIVRQPAPATDFVNDETFALYRRLYDYDPRPLEARLEATDEAHQAWRKEIVSFTTAYGKERMSAHIFIPRNAKPPYQTVVFFPGSDAIYVRSSRELWLRMVDFYIRSGRVVVYPIYQGTYERGTGQNPSGPVERRDLRIQRAKDVRRTLDYLETRQDIDQRRIVAYGFSLGCSVLPLVLATDDRFAVAVMLAGGLSSSPMLPEADVRNFLSRVRTPLIHLAGKNDFIFPPETSQLPYFRLVGSDPSRKRFVGFEGGHIPSDFNLLVREILTFTDQHLGPVRSN